MKGGTVCDSESCLLGAVYKAAVHRTERKNSFIELPRLDSCRFARCDDGSYCTYLSLSTANLHARHEPDTDNLHCHGEQRRIRMIS